MLKEKRKKLEKLKNDTEVQKKKAQKMLFPSSNEAKINNVTSNWIEKDQLQLLNFQIVNEISKTNYFIICVANLSNLSLPSLPGYTALITIAASAYAAI